MGVLSRQWLLLRGAGAWLSTHGQGRCVWRHQELITARGAALQEIVPRHCHLQCESAGKARRAWRSTHGREDASRHQELIVKS